MFLFPLKKEQTIKQCTGVQTYSKPDQSLHILSCDINEYKVQKRLKHYPFLDISP